MEVYYKRYSEMTHKIASEMAMSAVISSNAGILQYFFEARKSNTKIIQIAFKQQKHPTSQRIRSH